MSGIDRDATTLDGQGVANDFDLEQIKENQELGQAAGYVGMRTVGMIGEHFTKGYETAEVVKDQAQKQLAMTTDPAERARLQSVIQHADAYMAANQGQYDAWKDGGSAKILLHGMVGAATAALGGGNALQGALGATASEAASGAMQNYLQDHGVDPDSAKGKSLMGLASTAIGAAAGQGAGAATALQGEKYNRQLHPSEISWIKAHAAQFAKQQCGGCEPTTEQIKQATSTLSQQALREVDALWRMYIPEGADAKAAQTFLATAQGSFTNQKGEQQALFATKGNQFLRSGMYADTASPDFYKAYVQPGATRSFAEGFKVETGHALSIAGRCASSANCVGNVAGSLAEGAYNGIKKGASDLYNHPWTSIKSVGQWVEGAFKEGGNTWGETVATWGGPGASKLNQLYGKDVTAAQRTLSGMDSVWVLANAVGAGKAIGAVGEQAVKSVAKEVVERGATEAKLAASKLAKLSYTSIKDFRTEGLNVTPEVMGSPEAKAMLQQYIDSGVSEQKALDFTADQLASGEELPSMFLADSDMELIKLVPKNAEGGDVVLEYTPFFVTRKEYGDVLSGMSSSEIANYLGLPVEQGIRGSQLGFDVYEMTPKTGENPLIFESRVAPIKQGEYSADGGAEQIIVPDRSKWTDPNKHKIGEIKGGH